MGAPEIDAYTAIPVNGTVALPLTVLRATHPEVSEIVGTLSDGAHNGGGSTVRTRTRDASSLSQHYLEIPEVAWCLQHRDAKGADSDTKPGHLLPIGGSFDAETFVKTHEPMTNQDAEGWSPQDHSPTITHWPRDRSDAGTDVAVVQPMAFDARQSDTIVYGDRTGPLDTDGHSVGVCVTGDRTHALTVAFTENHEGRVYEHDYIGALNQGGGKPGMCYPAVRTGMSVRRLTPTECERLQGFPDGWTQIAWKGKPASECPDGPRYRALGNSMAVNVMRWIGRRIEMVDGM